MYKNVKLLDCTLRDGGRVINCAFPDKDIKSISNKLAESGIDIIEVGFLRDPANVSYNGNSTFFTDVDQIRPFVDHGRSTKYVAFIDYELYDFNTLKPYDGTSIDGVRVGWKKSSFSTNKEDIIKCLKSVKEKGYMLFIQGVNTLGYTDRELLDILDFVNQIHPDGFGIVDTYGAMYLDDLQRIFTMVDHNLDPTIAIDFHSHNNFQLSFALAQETIRLSRGQREVILDGTLNGMGKGSGNLNIELIVDFLVRKKGYNYNFDLILDIIDEYMYTIKEENFWGYSIPSFMAGVFKSHPNNIIYLTDKFRLSTKDIKYILNMLDEGKRQTYDYDLIEKLYVEYNSSKVDDTDVVEKLKERIEDRPVLVVAPGASIQKEANQLNQYIKENNPFIISINFRYEMSDMIFFGSPKRYDSNISLCDKKDVIITSNIKECNKESYVVDYSKVIECGWKYFDNSAIMLLRLLKRINVKTIAIAGLDGFDVSATNYYQDEMSYNRNISEYNRLNTELRDMLISYKLGLPNDSSVSFVTTSMFAKIFD